MSLFCKRKLFSSFKTCTNITAFGLDIKIIKPIMIKDKNKIHRITLAVGALARAFCSRRRALSNSLFSDSNLTAASQISSLLGLAWKAKAKMLLAAGTSPC